MQNDNVSVYEQYPGEAEAIKHQKWQRVKDVLYKFFYNIWPSVNRILQFIVYHTIRIIKGSVKIAMEQFHNNS